MKDWRDPNMKVTVSLQNPQRTEEWEPSRYQEAITRNFNRTQDYALRFMPPHWSQDPTYNLRKRPQKQARTRRR